MEPHRNWFIRGILLVIGWEYITEVRVFPARLVTVYALIGSFVLLVLVRELLRFTRGVLFRFGKGTSRVLIVGNSPATHDIAQELSDTQKSGFRVVAIAGPKRLVPDGLKVAHYSTIEAALRDIKRLRVTTIIQTDLSSDSDQNQKVLGAAQINHIRYSFIPGEAEFYTGKNTVI